MMNKIACLEILVRGAVFMALPLLLPGCRNMTRLDAGRNWAEKAHIRGLENCYQLSPGIYRSAQPSAMGFAEMEKAGIRSVLCLCSGYADVLPSSSTMVRVHYVRLNPLCIHDGEIAEALRIMSTPSLQPILVHCRHGSDRTGAVCAAYRVVFQGWTKEEAVAEMTRGGFGFHEFLPNLARYILHMDVEGMRRMVMERTQEEL